MNFITKEFVANENRARSFQASMVASALAGFVAGAAVASIIFLTGIIFSSYFLR